MNNRGRKVNFVALLFFSFIHLLLLSSAASPTDPASSTTMIDAGI
jgi:hypothetical protein